MPSTIQEWETDFSSIKQTRDNLNQQITFAKVNQTLSQSAIGNLQIQVLAAERLMFLNNKGPRFRAEWQKWHRLADERGINADCLFWVETVIPAC